MAEAQLKLDVEVSENTDVVRPEIDLVDSVLMACGGDHRLAIKELLADADFLRDELYTASKVMSSGMARGWKPRYERV